MRDGLPTGTPGAIETPQQQRRGLLGQPRHDVGPVFNEEGEHISPIGGMPWRVGPVGLIASMPLEDARDNIRLLYPSNVITPSATKGRASTASPSSAVEVHRHAPKHGIPAMHGILLVTLHGPVCLLGPRLGLPPKPVRLHWTSSNVGVCGFMAACQQVLSRQLGNNPSTVTVLPHSSRGM
jgi:hypothetical protein